VSLRNRISTRTAKILPELYDFYRRKKTLKKIDELKKLSTEGKKILISDAYKKAIGHDLDWSNLKTYTEKMQWEKLFHKDKRKTDLTDKYLVRDWVSKKIGPEYLIPMLDVWDSFSEIDFDKLPNQFVLKTNHGSGTNVIVKDQSAMSRKKIKRKFDYWMSLDFAYTTMFEMHYSDIQPKIIAEKYLETELGELQDYKFLCFDGVPYYCWVDLGRYSSRKRSRTVFDMEWNLQPWTQADYGICSESISFLSLIPAGPAYPVP
jgi:hypothetical protein